MSSVTVESVSRIMSAHKIEEPSKQVKKLKDVRERIKKGDFLAAVCPSK